MLLRAGSVRPRRTQQPEPFEAMRLLFILILLAGVGLGIAYPWAVANFSGHELGTWPVYDAAGGFRPVDVRLSAADAPVRVLVDLTAAEDRIVSQQRTLLTLTAATGGRTVLASTLGFTRADPRQVSPQQTDKVFRDDAGLILDVKDADYRFTVGPGDADDIRIRAVDLVLRSGTAEVDPRARPIGIAMSAVGLFGFLVAVRLGRTPQNPNSQPPPPRWGRGSDSN